MANAIPVPEQPGRLYIPSTNSVIQQDAQYEGDYYDTVEFTTFTAGTKQDVFKAQTGTNGGAKELQHTNLTQTKRIPSYAKFKLIRLGVHVRQWIGSARPSPEDTVAMYETGNLRFFLGSTYLIAEGPLLAFPSGIGVTGVSSATDFSLLSLGVASYAAAPRLVESQDINDKLDLNCTIRTDAQLWLNAADNGQPAMVGNGVTQHLGVSVVMHGIITKPLGG